MASSLSYSLLYAGTPFLTDVARTFGTDAPGASADLIDEANRLLPSSFLQDFAPPTSYPGRNLTGIAARGDIDNQPDPHTIRVGTWFYPTTASRWSVFRMLATSKMAQAMLDDTGGDTQQTFAMKCVPIDPADRSAATYTISTSMYMLPPRPIAETGGTIDGLYLITLVDSRWYLQGTPVTLHPNANSTWTTLLASVATATGLTISFQSTPSAAYGTPEPDSPLWCNGENAAVVLDAIAYNTGRVVVRLMNGSFILRTPVESQAIVNTNRTSDITVVRMAGGNLFYSSGGKLPIGDLTAAKNAVIPTAVVTHFPKYIASGDPVPHFLNPRQANQQPTSWFNASYPDTYSISVGIASGGSLVNSGYTGTSTVVLHDTAKALYSSEAAATGDPGNVSGLTSIAMQLAADHYNNQVAYALDEVYPGTVNWTPEGIHDIVWTWSERSRQASTRVMRSPWNQIVTEFQHSLGAVGGQGPSQTWQDSVSGVLTPSTTLAADMLSGDFTATFAAASYFPSQNRWKGRIGTEDILFEGTSGGTAVGVVRRGIDGTAQAAHATASTVSGILANTTYAVNLVKFEKGQYVYPDVMSSGGVNSVHVIPQTQNVRALAGSGAVINSIWHYSGRVSTYAPPNSSGSQFINEELCWVVEPNSDSITSGKYYQGTFAGWASSGGGPVYTAYQAIGSGGGPTPPTTATVISGTLAAGTYADHQLPNANIYHLFPTGPVILQSLKPATGSSGLGTIIEIFNAADFPAAGAAPDTLTYTNNDAAGTSWQRVTTIDANPMIQQPQETIKLKYMDTWHPAEREPTGPGAGTVGGGAPAGRSGIDTTTITNTNVGIYSGAIGIDNIASGAVRSGHIASGNVGWPHIANEAVRSGHIQSGNVDWPHLANSSVRSGHIASGNVGWPHIGSGAIQSGHISSGSVGPKHLSSGAVQSGHIFDGAVVSGSVASGSLGAVHLMSGTYVGRSGIDVTQGADVRYVGILSGAIGRNNITNLAIGSGQLDINIIDPTFIAAGYSLNTGTGGAADISYFRQVGTSPIESWYVAGKITHHAANFGAGATPTADVIYALPFVAPRGGTLDRIAIRVVTPQAAKTARIGIYSATSATNLYPNALLVDAVVNVTVAQVEPATISQALSPGQLYWFVLTTDATTALLASLSVEGLWPIFGIPSDLGTSSDFGLGLAVADAYGALPDPFPAGATVMYNGGTLLLPVIACRFSA